MKLRTLALALCLASPFVSCRKPAPAGPPDPMASQNQRLQSLDMPEAQSDALSAPAAGIRVIVGPTSLEINALAALAEHPGADRTTDPATLAWVRGRSVPFAAQRNSPDGQPTAVLIPELRDGLQSLSAWRPTGVTEPLPVAVFLTRAVSYRQADAILGAVSRAGYRTVQIGFLHGGEPRTVELSLPDACAAAPEPQSPRCAVSRVRIHPAGYLVQALAYHREQLACTVRGGDVDPSAQPPSPNANLQVVPPAMPTLLGPQVPDGVRDWVGRVMFGAHKECPSVPRTAGSPYDGHALAQLVRDVSAIAPGCPMTTVVPQAATTWGEVALTLEALRAEAQMTVRLSRPDARTEFDCVGAVRPSEVAAER